ncbi:MAG: serine protease [Candidatus Dadabacteria bacterium]|nr:MAG: serine protease [Candidatus Dadabacteria bacterium]
MKRNGLFVAALLAWLPIAVEIASAACPLPVKVEALDAAGRILDTGSGFVALDGRAVITAAHVVADAHSVRIETPDGIRRLARTADRDVRRDVAVLRLRGRGLSVEGNPQFRSAQRGDAVDTIGHIPTLGFVMFSNRVRATNIPSQMGPVIETEAPWVAGISGAPLVTPDCSVVGLASFGTNEPVPHYYAIPSVVITELLHED